MNELCLRELSEIIGGRLKLGSMPPLGGDLEPVGRIVADCRLVMPGDVFWSLPVSQHDGSRFAEEAYSRGAHGAVVAGRQLEPWAGKFSIEVEDTRWALWQLARWTRRRFTGTVIAVTGGVGKTTTRQMIDTVLRSRLYGSSDTIEHAAGIGAPLGMLDLDEGNDYGILELHAESRGETDSLAHLCIPHVGVITGSNNGHGFACGFKQTSVDVHAELLAALPSDGCLVLNGDDPWLRRMAGRTSVKKIWVGRGSHCDVVASRISNSNGELAFDVDGMRIRIPVWGRHHLVSALAAYAVGRLMNIATRDIASALSEFHSLPTRCEMVDAGGFTIINDTYHADAASMQAALGLLRDFESPGRRIVVCGELADANDRASQVHRQTGEQIVNHCGADMLVACGEFADDVVTAARDAGMPPSRSVACREPQEAARVVQAWLSPGDVVLVKGRREMSMQRVVEKLNRNADAPEERVATSVPPRKLPNHASLGVRTNIIEVPPFALALREADAALPPG
jgi:UDP-N-acetylmuramoyl-tripeptide--D-alanyl-D-alanine ligase